MDKTGTSAIQRFLFKNRQKLDKQEDLYYPATGIWNDFSHHPFAFSIFEMSGYNKKNLEKLFRKLSIEIRNKKTILMSSECLFKAPLKENFIFFKEFIEREFIKVKIVGYVRRQDEWVESRHKHSILVGHELSLEQLQKPFFCNYKQFFDGWADIVGKSNVIVRPYERQQFVGGSILSDFLSIFGISDFSSYTMEAKTINHSLGVIETEFKRYCNLLDLSPKTFSKLNQLLLAHSENNKVNEKYFLSSHQRKAIIDKYAEINHGLSVDYGQGSALFLDLDTGKDGDCSKSTSVNENMARIFDFIYKEDKRLFSILNEKINEASQSEIEEIKASAKILMAREN